MANFLAAKCTEIRNWLAIGSEIYPDTVVTSWIRMADEQLSTQLRIKHMIQIDTATVVDDRVPLPKDWQEINFVRILPAGGVCRYQTRDEFYNPEFPNPPKTPYTTRKARYCISGNNLILGDVTSSPGLQVELTYYQNIPPLLNETSTDVNEVVIPGGQNNWINEFHPTLYTVKILHIASMYAIEDDRSPTWESQSLKMAMDLNQAHLISKASGSVLVQTRRKSFG